jgi:hypothetical protein
MNEMAARGVAAIGIVLATVAVWIDGPQEGFRYWDDGTAGAWLLILCGLCAALLAAGIVLQSARYVRLAAGVAVLLLGFYLWLPSVAAWGEFEELEAGAWLGVAGAALAVVGALAGSRWQGTAPVVASAAGKRGILLGTVLAIAGLVMSLVAIWTDFIDIPAAEDGGSLNYWDISDDKMLGVVMVIVIALCGFALLAAFATGSAGAALWASLFALLLAGLMVVVPIAVNDFEGLDVGGWLGLIGGILAFLGAQYVHMSTVAGAPARVPEPAHVD